ncbi:MAG: FAD-dependent oxidoreductase [Chloroflexi bacterium]|nr:FAD-dependent oxidoreductase [Chloroflexota bacterium]MDA1146361.1 FAD-dependent oxidoreductase [Chloroflexota bacterium]
MIVYGPNHIFEFAVIGGGLFGSAATRHLASDGHDVVLLAPPEPEDRATHRGPFASHYDEGRITRVYDADPLWSRLARASIDRYAEIEADSGITFHTPNGYLGVGSPQGRLLAPSEEVGQAEGATAEHFDAAALAARFPFLRFDPQLKAFLEPGPAGRINPRALVRAQLAAAKKHGATILPRTAITVTDAIDAVDVLTDDATRVLARRALITAGAFANELLIRPLALEVQARTLLFARLDAAQREALAGMPSIIHVPADGRASYLLPPVTYPDGETYVKIGMDEWDGALRTPEAITAWFRSENGDPLERLAAEEALSAMIPSLAGAPRHTANCVYTITASGHPYVGMVSQRLAVAIGGNGKGAKSSDEIGRLGAAVLKGEDVDARLAPRFA